MAITVLTGTMAAVVPGTTEAIIPNQRAEAKEPITTGAIGIRAVPIIMLIILGARTALASPGHPM